MSEAIGETFVTITPIVDAAAFKAEVTAMQGDLQAALAEAQVAQERAATVGKKALVGQATTEEAAAALDAYTSAARRAATIDVERNLATGAQSVTLQSSINFLRQDTAATLADTAATDANTRSQRQNNLSRASVREQLRGIATGREGLSSLGGLGGIAKLGLGGLAIAAVFQGVQRLGDALKVTGDEAFTTEGKFRNFGAALLKGDVVGGFLALNAHAKSAADQLKDLSKEAATTSVDLRNFGTEASRDAAQLDKIVEAQKRVGAGGAFAKTIAEAAKETRKAADDALALARAYDTAAIAAQDVTNAIAAAGSEAAAFGERTRGVPPPRVPRGDSGGTTDSTATNATSNAEAQSRAARTKTLQDDLAQLKVEAAQAAALEKNQLDIVEGRAARHQATVEARTKVVLKQQQIDDEAAAERKRANDAATTAAKKAASDAKSAAAERAAALRAGLAFREDALQGALQDAQSGSLADQRKALQALISFNLAESRNRGLDKSERQKALLDAKQYQRDLNDLNKEALASALGVKKQNLQNAIEAAKLTDPKDDDDRANARYLKFLKAEVTRAKKLKDGGAALAAAKGDLIAFQLALKSLKDAGGGGFTLEGLFAEAQKQFQEFGSNVSGGVTTGGGVRGNFGAAISAQNIRLTDGERQQISEAQRSNALLAGILGAVTRSGTAAAPESTAVRRLPPGQRAMLLASQLAGTTG